MYTISPLICHALAHGPGPQMTPAEARIVDPVLTTHALGYREPMFTGHELFPFVDVGLRGGRLIDFGDDMTEVIDTVRAPGADAKEVYLRYGSKKFALTTHGLDAVVPREVWQDAAAVPPKNLAARAVEQAMKPILRNLEIAQAGIAQDPNNYAAAHKVALAGGSQWNDAVDPTDDVKAAVNQVELASGGTDIVVHIGADVMNALRTNAAIADKIKYTQSSIVTEELLARLWGVRKVVVGRSLKKDPAGARVRVWGKHVIVAHVPQQNRAYDEPSYGYTFRLRGTPTVNVPYYNRKPRSWVYDVDADFDTNLTMADAGYLIQNAVA